MKSSQKKKNFLQNGIESVAPPTQGTWRSNDYISAVRLVDA